MTVAVIFRSAALADIQQAYEWYESKRPGLGASFMAELGTTQSLIGTNPELFGKLRGDVRRAMLHRFPYAVFYVARSELVSVIAVMHHARNPKAWQGRG